MAEPTIPSSSPRDRGSHPRRHRIVRACVAAVGAILIVISVCSLIPRFTDGGLFLGVFAVDTPLVVLRLLTGTALVASSFAGTFVWGRVTALTFGLCFGVLGLAGGLTTSLALGIFRVSVVDNSFHVLLCTVLLGVGALSLDRFAEIAT